MLCGNFSLSFGGQTASKMSSLADLPEVIGFFSYSREDDEAFEGTLSALRDGIQRELAAQLGRSKTNFRVWQDQQAIASGQLWESEILMAIEQAVFFIPIVTPRAVNSHHCKFEFEAFLAREQALDRTDLVFPILYIGIPALEAEAQWRKDPVLSIIGARQYVDWRPLRHVDIGTTAVREAIERFCSKIVEALRKPWVSPERRNQYQIEPEQRLQAERHITIERSRTEPKAEPRAHEHGSPTEAAVPALPRNLDEEERPPAHRLFGRRNVMVASVIVAAVLVLALALGGIFRAPTGPPPATADRWLAVAGNSGPTPIGILAPSDPNYPATQLSVRVTGLPSGGKVVLADRTTAVAAGETLTVAQLTALMFLPTPDAFDQSSTFTYDVKNPAGLTASGTATLTIGPKPTPAGTIYIGNNLTVPNGGPDGVPPLVILGKYRTRSPLGTSLKTFPTAGKVVSVKFFGSEYHFTFYALSLVRSENNEQTFRVDASESFSGFASRGIQILTASNFFVKSGDLLAFSGIGPYYPQNPNDAVDSDATYEDASNPNSFIAAPPSGVVGSQFTVGGTNPSPNANYKYISDFFGNQGRIYGIGVDFSPGTTLPAR